MYSCWYENHSNFCQFGRGKRHDIAHYSVCIDPYMKFFSKEIDMATGTVKWFNEAKGFGFISPDDGSGDLFAHYTSIEMGGFKTLIEGQKVRFDITQGIKGKQASNIQNSM
jgi:CspA family cold shock protein